MKLDSISKLNVGKLIRMGIENIDDGNKLITKAQRARAKDTNINQDKNDKPHWI